MGSLKTRKKIKIYSQEHSQSKPPAPAKPDKHP